MLSNRKNEVQISYVENTEEKRKRKLHVSSLKWKGREHSRYIQKKRVHSKEKKRVFSLGMKARMEVGIAFLRTWILKSGFLGNDCIATLLGLP